jgi:rubrerythrin
MNFLETAKELELRGMEHYLRLAEMTSVNAVAGIFRFLASEEKRHFGIFDAWSKSVALPEPEKSEAMENTATIFNALTSHFKSGGVPAVNHGELYEKALEFENRSLRFYTDLLKGEEPFDEKQRSVLAAVIDQEQRHVELITSLMEFMRHPGEWIENAEFRHADAF